MEGYCRGIKLATKVKLVEALVFPIVTVLYGADTWTMRKAERKKVDAFEMWCWRRVMGMSWMERNTKVWLLENIKPEWTLELRVAQAALRYFGHVVREERGMENDAMLGEMSGKRRRGRPRTRWLDNGPSINSMRWDARDRSKWRSATARGRTRPNDTR